MKMIRRMVLAFLSLIITFSMAACGDLNEVAMNQSGGNSKEDSNSTKVNDVSIESQVLMDVNGYKVIAKSIGYNKKLGVLSVQLDMTNFTDKDILIETENVAVNGIMVDSGTSCYINAGSTETADMVLEDLNWNNIQMVSTIDLQFQVFDSQTMEKIAKMGTYTIQTSAADVLQSYDDSGVLIYDANNIRMIAVGTAKDQYNRDCYKVYIDNSSERSIYISAVNMFVNGDEVDTSLSAKVLPGKKRYMSIPFYQWETDGMDLAGITDVQLMWYIFDADTNESIANGERCIITIE